MTDKQFITKMATLGYLAEEEYGEWYFTITKDMEHIDWRDLSDEAKKLTEEFESPLPNVPSEEG